LLQEQLVCRNDLKNNSQQNRNSSFIVPRMGGGNQQEPLLSRREQDEQQDQGQTDAWHTLEEGTAAEHEHASVTVQELIQLHPDHVVKFIAEKGLVKLGTFKAEVGL
jgi:hypothetical protein